MASEGVQCPKCRAVSYPGLMGFPRCHRCHEQLRQCRYCVHQTAGLCQLERAQRPRLQADEGKPFCEAFTSRLPPAALAAAAQSGLSERARGVWFGVVLAVVLGWVVLATVAGDGHDLRIEPEERVVHTEDGRAVLGFEISGGTAQGWARLCLDPAVLVFYSVVSPIDLSGSPQPTARVPLNRRGRGQFGLTLLAQPDAPPETVAKAVLFTAEGRWAGEAKIRLLNPDAYRPRGR